MATAYVAANVGKVKQTDTYGLYISAQELSERPQTYFTLDNPDSYVLQAVTKSGELVYVGNWDNTQIDNLIQTNQISNIEFNGHYYAILLASGDPPPALSGEVIQLLIIGWLLWGISVGSTIVIRFKGIRNRPKPATNHNQRQG